MQSSIPAIWSSFLGTGADTIPVPRGAGISLTQMEPHFPVTLQGTVCGFPILFPQNPRLTGTMDSLAIIMAPRMAVATSLLHFTPRPTSIVVSDGNKSLEPGPLSSTSLFLHGHDLQDLILERRSNEQVNDLVLLDREREQVDFLQRLDPSILHQTS